MKSRDGNFSITNTPDGTFKVRFFDVDNVRRSKTVKTKTDGVDSIINIEFLRFLDNVIN